MRSVTPIEQDDDSLARGLLDFASSILEYPGYSAQSSGDLAHCWLFVGGHGGV